jgi:hypothetical protein
LFHDKGHVGLTTKYFVELRLGNDIYKDKVSTEGWEDVADFKDAIKKKFSPLLNSYAIAQLRVFESDGKTEIGLKTKMEDVIVV